MKRTLIALALWTPMNHRKGMTALLKVTDLFKVKDREDLYVNMVRYNYLYKHDI